MRRFAVPLIFAVALGACSAPPSDQKPAAEPAKAAPAAAPAPPPAAAPVAAAPLPEGACGDQSAVAKEARLANTPRWTTASEVENFGYDVFRGDAEEGPFTKLTESPLAGAGTTDETKKYEFRDDTIDPCKDYWYYVESISTTGVREKFTPVFKAPAKRRAAATP
jgi:hypothetical protein